MSERETSVRMTSLKGATRDEDLHSQVSGSSSRRSRLSRRSSRSSKSELSARKASLEAKKENESKMLMLLKEDKEAKQAFHQNRKAVLEQKMKTLELEQEDMENAYLSEQKVIAAQKSIVAADIEISELAILEECCEDDSETDDEVSIKGLTREKRSERMERFFGSQEEVTVKNIKPESPVVNTPPVSSPAVQARQDTAASSLEDCLQQLSRFVAGQNAASNQLAAFSQLPKIDVPIFSGDPLQYTLWKNAFDCTVDSKPIGEQYKLNYLNAYVSGRAKEIVEHHLLIGGSNAYQEALKQLEDRFGDPNTISVSYTKKLTSWPKISSHDASGLRDFADFLQKVVAAKRRVRNLGILDYPQENVKLVEKLPGYLEGKWRDEIDRWRSHKGPQSFPSFTEFAEFVMRAASKANIPEMEPLSKESKPNFKANQRSMKARTFVTNGQDGEPSKQSKALSKHRHGRFSLCPFCERDHHIEDCDRFAKNSVQVRKAFFRKKMICLGCGGTDNHFVKHCHQRKSCKLCGKMHLTCLHYDQTKPDGKAELQEGTSNCTSVCLMPDQDGRDHSMIVPVWVRHVDRPSEETLEYAILDDQSNVSFVSKRLCKKLDVKGEKTNLLLTTVHQTGKIESERIKGLEVLDFNKENVIQLPITFSRDSVPASRSQIPKPEVVKQWDHLNSIASKMMPYRKDVEVSLLIGNDCTRAVRPREIITGNEDDPYAQRSLLGWGVVGRVCKTPGELKSATCNKISVNSYPNFSFQTKVKEIICPERIIQALEADFKEENEGRPPLSVQDVRFLDILEKGITKRQDGHYEMPLPFKSDQVQVPNNRHLAVKRWNQLNARFRKSPQFLADYKDFMKEVINSCAEKAPTEYTEGRVNYVPHTGVYHPKKPGKIRVVFDCSAKYQGISLNDNLLQGPDMTNGLLGVLCRFRQEDVAVMADIKSMFHQFYVPAEDRDMLRFLWWEDGDSTKQVIEYRMMVHLFGAASSPSCANFGLKRAANDGEEEFGEAAANYIRNEFYVDDGLKSVSSVEEAVSLMKAAQNICSKAGLHLHKIMSNKKEVLESFPIEDRAKGVAELNLAEDPLPLERALGVVWCVESDSLQFRLELHDKPLTRRGILSTVSSIYDPNGYVSPVTLRGKQILQELCRGKLDWDSPIPEVIRAQWEKWRQEIGELEKFKVQRCFKPPNFGEVKHAELHHFSDASQDGYGQCSYIRLVNGSGEVSCSLVLAKSRVTPLKAVTIPRLELVAATISAKMSGFLRKELRYKEIREFFWTDSKIVLGYINNEARRFHVYVSNRVQEIRNRTNPSDWYYVDTSCNPADDASRGLTASELLHSSRWLEGPTFLHVSGQFQPPIQTEQPVLEQSDPEVRRVSTLSTRGETGSDFDVDRLHHISSWKRARRVMALCLRYKRNLQAQRTKRIPIQTVARPLPKVNFSVADLQEAEMEIIRCLQRKFFAAEKAILQSLSVDKESDREKAKTRNQRIKATSSLYRLDPFIDCEGIIRVGGRINRANVSRELKHPIIIPRQGHMTSLLIRHHHEQINHMGRGMSHNHLRQSGYWVIGGSSAVSSYISKCIFCKKMRGSLQQQKMAELPEDRLTSSSFINCLRRFLSRRGPVRQIRSDRGTAFVGARNELRQAIQELDEEKVKEYLQGNKVDWIPFNMNTPHSSHMGGVWERQIATVRRALEPLLISSGNQLDDESFRTFLTEVESIVNSRPLSTKNLCSPDAPEPLTPNHLLTMKPKIVLPPPGKFQTADSYCRKWWRRVQHLSNEFWLRWRKEFLAELQTRQKWVTPKRSVRAGDVVIVKEEGEFRGNWPLGRVEKVLPSKDGHVRKVQLMMANKCLDEDGRRKGQPTILERPIHKLVVLIPTEETSQGRMQSEDQRIPDQGASQEENKK
ncbi:uncharacterized protein LOC121431537 isoform X2 [Lytechinus variegatus]|uniref:uncharacterized protein LOC121431537 isoform X2 n=1 Tax=Lytechinus variegatus TaxID=7654 RepID=UPI001BB204C3|nr:uncharacterized protein LOC121431537 isoform X2 [Lytechinus variegatus]